MTRCGHRRLGPLLALPALATLAAAALSATPAAAAPAAKQPTPSTSKSNPGKGHQSPSPGPTASPTPSPSPTPTPTLAPTTSPATPVPAPPAVGPVVQGTKAPSGGTAPAPAVAGVQRPAGSGSSGPAGPAGSGGSTPPGSTAVSSTAPAGAAPGGAAASHRPGAKAATAREQLRLHHDERAELGPIVHSLSQGATSNPQLPLGLFGVLGLFLLVQNRIDRRDPKLAVTQAWSSVELEFRPVRRTPAAVRRRELPVRLQRVDRPVSATDLLPPSRV